MCGRHIFFPWVSTRAIFLQVHTGFPNLSEFSEFVIFFPQDIFYMSLDIVDSVTGNDIFFFLKYHRENISTRIRFKKNFYTKKKVFQTGVCSFHTLDCSFRFVYTLSFFYSEVKFVEEKTSFIDWLQFSRPILFAHKNSN